MSEREAVVAVLSEHNIECTGLGEVTCRGCRERGWMSWPEYRGHLADAVLVALAATESSPLSQENYDGPDPSVECAWPPCRNRLRRSDCGGPQWCSKAHRSADLMEAR